MKPIGIDTDANTTTETRRQADTLFARVRTATAYQNRMARDKLAFLISTVHAFKRAMYHDGCVMYTRNKSDPAYRAIYVQVIDAMRELGLVYEHRSPKGAPKMSRLLAMPEMEEFSNVDPWSFDPPTKHPLVYLKDRETEKEIEVDWSLPIAWMTRDRLDLINAVNGLYEITYEPVNKWSGGFARADGEFVAELANLEELSAKWKNIQTEKNTLPRDDSSEADRKKIAYWGDLLREQLRQYDFRSLDIDEIGIYPNTYRPSHGGFDMQTLRILTRDAWDEEARRGFDLATSISASDFIRVIWSCLNALREVGLKFPTRHPGLLVFDEPRQQSAKDLSFEQLLRRVACAGEQGHQVIFATSEKEDTLRQMLNEVPHTYHAFEGYVISRLSS